MGRAEERRRATLFGLVCAALLTAALLFSADGSPPHVRDAAGGRPAPAPRRASTSALRTAVRAQRLAGELRRTAHRFLAAFLRYEVGEGGLRVAVALRATATRGFADRLFAAPPRAAAAGGFPPPARLGRLEVGLLSAAPSRALISASAERDGRPEQLSFLFVRRRGGWLASGPGQ